VKVLVVSHLYPRPSRAAALFVHDQVVALTALGVALEVVSPTPSTPRALRLSDRLRARGATPPAAVIEGVAVTYPRVLIPPRRLAVHHQDELLYRGLRPLLSGLRADPPDLVHAHQAFPDGAAARLLAQDLAAPYVVTVHGADVNVNLTRPGALRERTLRALNGAAAVMAVSTAVTRRLAGLVPPERLHTVVNGVRGQAPATPTDLLPGRRCVLSVGNLYASKGHALVLDALARLGQPYADVAYIIVGDGPERRRLAAQARALGLAERVLFLGWRPHDEALGLMARADAFVLPSAPEGFGLVYAEAMAQGTPVVACRGEGPDDFIDDGASGLLVPAGDAGAVTRAVATLLDEPATATRLAAAGRAAVAALSWERNAARQLEIYEAVLAAAPALDERPRP